MHGFSIVRAHMRTQNVRGGDFWGKTSAMCTAATAAAGGDQGAVGWGQMGPRLKADIGRVQPSIIG